MRAIEYQAPTSLSEAVAIMAAHGDRASPLAGGTDILVQLRGGRRDADVLLDTKRSPNSTASNWMTTGCSWAPPCPATGFTRTPP